MAKQTAELISRVRALFRDPSYCRPPIKAYITSTGDAHQSEYLADCDQRVSFISGFTGSRGTTVITENDAAVWVDSRYYLQAEVETDNNWTVMKQGLPETPSEAKWLSTKLAESDLVGVDPYLITANKFKLLSSDLERFGQVLVPVSKNLVDTVWDDRPKKPTAMVKSHPVKYTGKSIGDKVKAVRKKMVEEKAIALVVEALDEVAYLLNLRGSDIQYNPVFFSYAIVLMDEVFLLIDDQKLSKTTKDALVADNITIIPYESLAETLHSKTASATSKVWIPGTSSQAVSDLIPTNRRITIQSPIALMKAIKSDTERKGMRNAHINDGVALCRYLHWLEQEVHKQEYTEISGADVLAQYRREEKSFVALSFDTISSVGSNAAIVHYKPKPSSDRVIRPDEIYLVDSGAHYWDGTTDITRTVHFGKPSDVEREMFTRVLKGSIALATMIFPEKTKGNRLDASARQFLWECGADYGHGTGHGIGMYLNVHEGPIGITTTPMDDPGLREGMFVSNEPGYYEDGKYGIRIENIVEVVKANTPNQFQGAQFLTFKTISMCPIQRKMIKPELLTKKEVDWINTYHEEVIRLVGPVLLDRGFNKAYEWLSLETSPIS